VFYYPERILFLGFVLYGVIFLVAPLEIRVEIANGSFIFIGVCCVAFLLGSRFDNIIRMKMPKRVVSRRSIQYEEHRLFRKVFAVGVLGNTIRLFDKYILRGVGGATGFEAREALIDSSASSISLIGAVLYPFGYIPIFIYLGSRALPRNRKMYLMSLVLFLVPAVDALVLFSRSFMLVSLAMIYFGSSLTIYRGNALPLRLIFPIMVAFFVVLLTSITLFAWRLEEMNLDILDSIFQSGYGFTIGPNAAAETLLSANEPVSAMLAGLLPIAQYFTHSLFEFQILWADAASQTHSYGALHFAPYMKVLSILGFSYDLDLWELFPRVGVFTSFFGPLWVDFGWLSFLIMFFFGAISRHIARQAQRGDLGAYPLYTQFCVVLFFAPVVNFLVSAQGIYAVNAFVVFWFLSRRLTSYEMESISK